MYKLLFILYIIKAYAPTNNFNDYLRQCSRFVSFDLPGTWN